MHLPTMPPIRRVAVIGATVALVTVASVTGVATVASAAPASPNAAPTATQTPTQTPSATPAAGSDLAFTEPSSEAAPLALTGMVDTPFSHTFHTTGGTGTVAYAIQDSPSPAFTVNLDTGVLSGTPTTAGTFDFEVVALSGSTQVTEWIRLTVQPASLAFTEPSTKTAPLLLTATAGTPFTHTFHTTGGSGAVAYAIQDSPSPLLSVNVETGVLTSTATDAGTYSFEVVALSGSTQVTEWVRLTVRPGAPVGVASFVTTGSTKDPSWAVAPNGTITQYGPAGSTTQRTVASIPVRQGGTLDVGGLAVDRFGNRTTVWTGAGVPRSTVTSSIGSDRITWLPAEYVSSVTFPHASDHRLTVREGGVSTSFVVAVQPVVSVGTTTPASAITGTGTGTGSQLAYTGADERGPIGWALGLLAVGAGLLVLRLRRLQR